MGNEKTKEFGIYIGRLSPIHLGHQAIINQMTEKYGDECMVVIGSAGHDQTYRHFFTYEQRSSLIHTLYPNIKTIPLSDFPTDKEWLGALDNLIETLGYPYKAEPIFFGGSQEDIRFFLDDGRRCQIINRYDGKESPPISASDIRDSLIEGRSITGKVDPKIETQILEIFNKNRKDFKKR